MARPISGSAISSRSATTAALALSVLYGVGQQFLLYPRIYADDGCIASRQRPVAPILLPWTKRTPSIWSRGERIRSSSSSSVRRVPLSFGHCSTASPRRLGSCGRCATTTGGSSTSASATAIPPCCAASGCHRRCGVATRCSRRCRRCAGVASSTPSSGCATPVRRGSKRSPTTCRSGTATCWEPSFIALRSSATGWSTSSPT
jgi:hypothetical protein